MRKVSMLLLVLLLLTSCNTRSDASPDAPTPTPSATTHPTEYVLKLPDTLLPDTYSSAGYPKADGYSEYGFIPSDTFGTVYPFHGWDKVGLVTSAGEIAAEPFYYTVGFVDNGEIQLYVARRSIGGGADIIPPDGSWIKSCEDAKPAGEYITAAKDGKWGILNLQLEWIIEPAYDCPLYFSDGLAAVCNADITEIFYINLSGKTVIGPYDYTDYRRDIAKDEWYTDTELRDYFSEGRAFRQGVIGLERADGTSYLLFSDGQIKDSEDDYGDKWYPIQSGVLMNYATNTIRVNGKELQLGEGYIYLYWYKYGLLSVTNYADEKEYIYNTDFELVYSADYQTNITASSEYIVDSKARKIYDHSGNVINNAPSDILWASGDFFVYSDTNDSGLMNSDFEVVIPAEYYNLDTTFASIGLLTGTKDGKVHYFDLQGKLFFISNYDPIGRY